MLTAINGFASLAEMEIDGSQTASNYLNQIRHAVSLAESLTRQLLIFSRKQTTGLNQYVLTMLSKHWKRLLVDC